MEHRWGERITLEFPVRLDFGPRVIVAGTLQNLSLSGGFIATRTRLPALSRVDVTLSPRRTGAALRCYERIPAQIVRIADDGIAIEWHEFAPPALRALISARRRALAARARMRRSDQPMDALEIV